MNKIIVLDKFVSYLKVNNEITDTTYEAYAAMSELMIEGFNVSLNNSNLKDLIAYLNNNDVVNCKIAITNEIFQCKVAKKTANQYFLEVLQEPLELVNNKLTIQYVFKKIDNLINANVVDYDFKKHLQSIITNDFFNSYFSEEDEVDEWLIHYYNNWNWR